jgi:hypothetical protein
MFVMKSSFGMPAIGLGCAKEGAMFCCDEQVDEGRCGSGSKFIVASITPLATRKQSQQN